MTIKYSRRVSSRMTTFLAFLFTHLAECSRSRWREYDHSYDTNSEESPLFSRRASGPNDKTPITAKEWSLYPYVVMIDVTLDNGLYKRCAGSIVADCFVLTASIYLAKSMG